MYRTVRMVFLLTIISCAACQSSGIKGINFRGLPSESSFTRDQLVIHTDFFLPKQHRILNDLVDLRYDLAHQLGLPLTEVPIEIYLFRDEKKFKAFANRHDLLADRRAFFVKRGDQMMVFSFWGSRAEEDLRHEVTHGYLHAVTDDLPLWMDEGIAEYFEVHDDMQRINWPHVRILAEAYRQGKWRPNLKPLEEISGNASLDQLQYAEAWLWIHFLLNDSDSTAALFTHHLQEIISGNAQDGSIFSHTIENNIPNWPAAIVGHLKELAEL